MAILREKPIETNEQFENTLQSVECNENFMVQTETSVRKLNFKSAASEVESKKFCWQEKDYHHHHKETIGCYCYSNVTHKRNRTDQGHCDCNFVVWNIGWAMFPK